NPLTQVNVPVVDSGAAENVYAGVAKIPQARAREGVDIEIPEEGALAFGQRRRAHNVDTRSFARSGDVLPIHGAESRCKRRSADERRDAAELPIVEDPVGRFPSRLFADVGE